MFRSLRAARPAPARVGFFDVTHAGQAYRVALKRVANARGFTLRIRSATQDAVLTMPTGSSLRAARTFAERNAEWIGSRMQRLPEQVPFAAGSTIPLRGVDTPIVHRPALRAIAWLEDKPSGPPVLCVSGTPRQQHGRVLAFLRAEAQRDLEAAVRRHAATVQRAVKSITLRDTRSRWGSCTGAGMLSFSWRLVMAPPHVLDYLAAHEVGHLVHMNHSAAFWTVVEELAPGMAEAEAWLKRHGASLHRFGALASAP